MQRKAFVSGVAVLLAALLAGCTGGSGHGGAAGDSKAGSTGATPTTAKPGRYRTLPEACGAVDHGTLDSLLPGIKQIADADQRDKAYQGEATLTYDTDRRVGCRWKVESSDATDHLLVDFERVVSYDNTVSDASRAEQLFAGKETAANLPAPAGSTESSGSAEASTSTDSPASSESSGSVEASGSSTPSSSSSASDSASGKSSGSATPSQSATASETPADLQPRTLDNLGDEAYLDDRLSSSGSTAQQRTVTVVFRTSNVIVTIEYDEQPALAGQVPDSKEMQDRARKLAAKLAGTLGA